jgi:flagellar biosynthesis/type III secretory pathway M-ring protein FliF/YscJ
VFSGNSRVFGLAFTGVFLVILLIGLLSGVTLKAGLGRAFMAGLLFSVLLWALFKVIGRYALPIADTADSSFPENHHVGGQLDLTVSDTSRETGGGFEDTEEPNGFSPITAKQIDPDLERVINDDPERVAEIVKKMGYDG